MFLPALVVLSTMHYEGDVAAAGGDYLDVPFEVPAGTVEIQITHVDGSDFDILDWGVWQPDGQFRGWGGGNLEDAIIGVDQSSRSYLPGPIAAGTWTVNIGKAKLDADGGHYAIDVVCRDTATLPVLPKAAFDPVVLAAERRWYKGDFHVHSEQSGDATATLDQIVTLARSRGLDFVNLSDHNTTSHHALAAAHQTGHPDLLFLRGAEITTYAGHGNAVGLATYVDHRIGFAGTTIAGLLDAVAAQGALFIVNHPTLDLGDNCIGCAWKHEITAWDRVAGMELLTGEWEVVEHLFTPPAVALWDSILDQSFRIAAIGGSDDHRAGAADAHIGSPTTLVLADNLSEAAIIDGIKHGRTMVMLRGPDDPFVDAHLVTADGALAEIGDDIVDVAHVELPVHVTGGAGMFLQLWRDGIKVDQIAIDSADFTATFEDTPGAADHRYRLEIIDDANRRIVITSHFFVHGIAGEGGGCCGTSRGDLSGLVMLLWLVRRARGGRSRRASAR